MDVGILPCHLGLQSKDMYKDHERSLIVNAVKAVISAMLLERKTVAISTTKIRPPEKRQVGLVCKVTSFKMEGENVLGKSCDGVTFSTDGVFNGVYQSLMFRVQVFVVPVTKKNADELMLLAYERKYVAYIAQKGGFR